MTNAKISWNSHHVKGGALERGLAGDRARGGCVRGPRVGVVPVAVPLQGGQLAVHLVHSHHGHLEA